MYTGLRLYHVNICIILYKKTRTVKVRAHYIVKITRYEDKNASAGNRTRVNCLEGSYAHHYTTDACYYEAITIIH
jgi:hypothetical protein